MESINAFFKYKVARKLVVIEFVLTYLYFLYNFFPFFYSFTPETFFRVNYLIQSLLMIYIWWTFRKALKEKFRIQNMDGFFIIIVLIIGVGQFSYFFQLNTYLPEVLSKFSSLAYSAIFIAFALKLFSIPEEFYGLKKPIVYSLIAIYILTIPYALIGQIFEYRMLFNSLQIGGFVAGLMNTIYMVRFFKRAETDQGKPAIDPLEEMIEEIGEGDQ
ncbi:MAG: hypothetical protein KDE26_16875 [Bacteroidetes bacterium]|nr:hypothetical protein [Bacteroidota bacterium]